MDMAKTLSIVMFFMLVLALNIFVVKMGWSLFAVSYFKCPELSLEQALGLTILIFTLRSSVASKA